MSFQKLMHRDFGSDFQILVIEFWSGNLILWHQQLPGPVRNANSLAWAGSTESAVCFHKFPGDFDVCYKWKASGLHALRESQPKGFQKNPW